ncbi:MAG: hypothetical protein LC623_02385 [Halobacteriales archaeon]|nr:hypothetical protein [Halobacteriales archaeon]
MDPNVLSLAASLLGIVAVVRLVSAGVPFSLAAFAGDALVGLAIVSALLLATGVALELPVLYVGAAMFAGLYWTGMVEKRPRLRTAGLVVSGGGAALAVVAVLFLARVYAWWFAPLALLLAMGLGLAVQGIGWLLARPSPAATPAASAAPASPARSLPPQPTPSVAAKVTITCPACGLRGQVAARGPPTLKCPRCGSPVQRPTINASPPPGGAPAQSTPPPPRRGPSS